jgi:histone H3/H4
MKLSKQKLNQFIKEEINTILKEVGPPPGGGTVAEAVAAVNNAVENAGLDLTDEAAVEQLIYRILDGFGVHKNDWADWEAEIYANLNLDQLDPLASEGCGDAHAESSGKNFPKLPYEEEDEESTENQLKFTRENKMRLSKADLRRIIKEEINDMIANPTSKEPKVLDENLGAVRTWVSMITSLVGQGGLTSEVLSFLKDPWTIETMMRYPEEVAKLPPEVQAELEHGVSQPTPYESPWQAVKLAEQRRRRSK